VRINTNMNALLAQRNMSSVNSNLAKSLERLSSGLRINSAKDDAAGLAISENMGTQIRALNVAEKNIQDAQAFLNAREGALEQLTTIAQRMRELAATAANTFNSPSTISALKTEFDQLGAEGARILQDSQFNGVSLFDFNRSVQPPDATTDPDPSTTPPTVVAVQDITLRVQVGVESAGDLTGTPPVENDTVALRLATPEWSLVWHPGIDTGTGAPGGADSWLDTTDPTQVQVDFAEINQTIGFLDNLLSDNLTETGTPNQGYTGLLSARAANGASYNRLEYALANLQVNRENLQSSQSRIRDTDVAAETINLTRQQIILQTSTAMLAQANTQPQSILALFQ
jgi:flagellin